MKRLILIVICTLLLIKPVSASEITAPVVPESGQAYMPDESDSFSEGLLEILKEAATLFQPALVNASGICLSILAIVLLVSTVKMLPGISGNTLELIGTIAVATILIRPVGTFISSGVETVNELSQYGKLLIPVLTAALAAQGGVSSSTALYTGTVAFNGLLSTLITSVIIPILYVFLALAVASGAIKEDLLLKLKAFSKWLMTWCLKIVLYVFTGYIGITGVVSGSVDAATLKATKLTVSGAVPVVGGILSDASEAILVSAGIMKNTAGVYGLLAIIAVWIGPFVEIGIQYLMLKATFAVCGIFSGKQTASVIQDFSSGMGMLLAMTGTVCLMLMVSVVCFMKGVNW